jgi:hypothetical protein
MQSEGITNNFSIEAIKAKISNPSNFGPGIWYTIHRMARDATTQDKKLKFKDFLENTIHTLPCSICVQHATEYYKSRPLDMFWNMKEKGSEIGLFRWSWQFHNAVNTRLKKQTMSWEVAKILFSDDGAVCTSDCGEVRDVYDQDAGGSLALSVSMIADAHENKSYDPLKRFIPKNIIRPNNYENQKRERK